MLNKVLVDYTVSECNLWTGSKMVNGYGYLNPPDAIGNKGKMMFAHRWFYSLYNPDEDITDKLIRHTCDNRLCVRKEHLISGSSQDNVNDMKERPKEKIFNSKIKASDLPTIKQRISNGDLIKDIAKDYALSTSCISRIKSGKTWNWVL